MIDYRVLQLDAGFEHLLPFAKRQVQRLLDAGLTTFSRTWPIDGATVLARCLEIARGQFVARIWLIGTMRSGLYNWAANSYQGVKDFSVSGDGDPAEVPYAQRVQPVELDALGTQLAFAVDAPPADTAFWSNPRMTISRFTSMFESMVRNDDWFARELLKQLFQHATILRNGTTWTASTFDLDECMVSRPDADGNFWMLLGRFPPDLGLGYVGALPTVDFTGMKVQWDVFAAALSVVPDSDGSELQVDLDSTDQLSWRPGAPRICDLVVDVSAYERLARGAGTVSFSGGSDVEIMQLVANNPTPFSVAYEHTHELTFFDVDQTVDHEVFRHSLETDGGIVVTNLLAELDGASTTFVYTPSPVAPSFESTLYLFEGEDFIKVGEHQQQGSGSTARYEEQKSVPSFSVLGVEIGLYGYAREHRVAIARLDPLFSNDLSVVHVSDTDFPIIVDTGSFAYTGGGPIAGDVNYYSHVHHVSGPTSDEFTNFVGIFGNGPVPQGQPYPYNCPGVFWHRPGKPLGVLFFQVPAAGPELDARAADVEKYKHVFNNDEGYRRVDNGDGTFTNEPGYEDPDVILARVMDATTVLVNNFAPPALFPWLAPTLLGVIVGI